VRVTDAGSGDVLFEDDFDAKSDVWEVEGGAWEAKGGLLVPTGVTIVTTGPQPWENYVLEAKLRNVTAIDFYVRAQNSLNGVGFAMRPYRHYDS
jgi:hypothetical protein